MGRDTVRAIPSWNEELVFGGVVYIMDSSNGDLYSTDTDKKVGRWEANYEYSVPDNCDGIVVWKDERAEDLHEVNVSRSLALSFFQEQEDAATTIQKYFRRKSILNGIVQWGREKGFMTLYLWPEAVEALRRDDFKEAAFVFRTEFQKSRPSNTDVSEPYTNLQILLLELQLKAEVSSQ